LVPDVDGPTHPYIGASPGCWAIQSVAVHLISLCAQLERGISSEAARSLLVDALRHRGGYVWLEPPSPPAELTVLHLRDAPDREDLLPRASEWAAAVWRSCSPHHPAVRRWADQAMHDRRS
jgi:hypothetical protein